MSLNKFKPHVYLIPEDDANRQLAVGFLLHAAVDDRFLKVRAPAGGWIKAFKVLACEYVSLLRQFPDNAHVILLIDFDDKIEDRKANFECEIPEDVRARVFVIGSKHDPENLKKEVSMSFETIGLKLAENCLTGDYELWNHPHLIHNNSELQRLVAIVKPILFSYSE